MNEFFDERHQEKTISNKFCKMILKMELNMEKKGKYF